MKGHCCFSGCTMTICGWCAADVCVNERHFCRKEKPIVEEKYVPEVGHCVRYTYVREGIVTSLSETSLTISNDDGNLLLSFGAGDSIERLPDPALPEPPLNSLVRWGNSTIWERTPSGWISHGVSPQLLGLLPKKWEDLCEFFGTAPSLLVAQTWR